MQTRMSMNTKISKNNKVMLGLSGGVDSTAAVLLLKDAGYQVTGYYFDVTGHNESAKASAVKAAETLGIDLICEDVFADFEKCVIDNFCREYAAGRTPNPCVVCNPNIKFKKLAEAADRAGAFYIATGHYADVVYSEDYGAYFIRRGADEKKDQSYMLYRLGQDVLSRLILPLAHAENKELVRAMVREKEIFNADAPDSQEICFIDENVTYRDFLAGRGFVCEKGNFVDSEGKVLGEHSGIMNYTVGQRKGLGIALGKPAFVVKINAETNEVVLGENRDLFSDCVKSTETVFTCDKLREEAKSEAGLHVKAKIRYASKPADAVVRLYGDGRAVTTFTQPQRAATPGQSIVFYKGELLAGGGVIG